MGDFAQIIEVKQRLEEAVPRRPINGVFAEGDALAHTIRVTLTKGNQPADLTGATVFGTFLRQGRDEGISLEGTITDNVASVTTKPECYAEVGAFVLVVKIQKDDEKRTIFEGYGDVTRTQAGTVITGDYIIMDVDTLVRKINEMETATTAANTAAANAQNVADEVQRKLDNGEFVGATGPAGADGADGAPGADGQDGAPGITPHIGANGNWWIGETDTGIPAQGPAGEGGAPNDAEPTTTNPYSGAKTQALHDELVIRKADAIMPTESGTLVHMEDSGEYPVQGLTVYGRSWQDGTPTPEAPVEIRSVGDGGLEVRAYGKNLADQFNANYDLRTIAWDSNGYATLKPVTNPNVTTRIVLIPAKLKKGNEYTLSYKKVNVQGSLTPSVYISQTNQYFGEGTSKLIVPNEDVSEVGIYIGDQQTGYEIRISDIQVEEGSTATPYEPYVSNTTTLVIEPLRGIPVASGGNVTVDGQQYIADTLIVRSDGTGEIERRAFSELLDASVNHSYSQTDSYVYYSLSNETLKDGICSHLSQISFNSIGSSLKVFGFSSKEEFTTFISENDVHIVYSLKTPITEQLTAAQVQQLLALHTYKPITNIYTADGAYMDATYIADTKAYVDTKPGTPGPQGEAGAAGPQGEVGPAGYTPQKGTDYWTEEDKAAMVADVLAALPNASGVSF